MERALAPGVDLARRGFARAPKNASRWAEDWQELRGEAAEVFRPAERHANSAMADTLEAIAAGRFYRGSLAQAIADASWLSPDDLAEHQNRWVEPVEFAFRDHVLLEMPPAGQGWIAGWALEWLASPAPRDQVAALADAYARGYATIGGTAYVCAADGEGIP